MLEEEAYTCLWDLWESIPTLTDPMVSVMTPYITSQFAPRGEADRPQVIPQGSKNFAFLRQYVEIPEDVVFTAEYSVRSAMHAVYGLFDVDRKIPGIYHAAIHPGVALRSLAAAPA